MDLLLKNNGGRDRRPNFVIFVIWSALNVDGWLVVGWGRESCLGLPEILSMYFVYCFGYIPELPWIAALLLVTRVCPVYLVDE